MKTRTWITAAFFIATLTACASSTNAVFQTLQDVVKKDSAAARAPLNPNFRYLRATIDGRVVLLVLGYTENDPQGPIEVWYSAEREVLRIQNGRLVGAVGLTTEWRNVAFSGAPSWAALKASESASRWIRTRDVMPGYHYGIREALDIRATKPPVRSALQELDPQQLAWFEEWIEPEGLGQRNATDNLLPLARYAVAFQNGGETVVYGEQCLSPKLCFAWQRWPAVSVSTNAPR